MNNIIRTPNLPEGDVNLCISALPIEGIETITPPPAGTLPPSMQRHADLQICHLGENVLLTAPEVYTYYKERYLYTGLKLLQGKIRSAVPTPLMRHII